MDKDLFIHKWFKAASMVSFMFVGFHLYYVIYGKSDVMNFIFIIGFFISGILNDKAYEDKITWNQFTGEKNGRA